MGSKRERQKSKKSRDTVSLNLFYLLTISGPFANQNSAPVLLYREPSTHKVSTSREEKGGGVTLLLSN